MAERAAAGRCGASRRTEVSSGASGRTEVSSGASRRTEVSSGASRARAVALGCAAALLAGCGGGAVGAGGGRGATASAAKAAARPGQVAADVAAEPSPEAAEQQLLDTVANSPAHQAMARDQRRGDQGDARGRAARAQLDPQSFRVAELPLVALPAPLVASSAPATLPAGEDPAELVVDWRGVDADRRGSTFTSVRVSVKGASYARLRIGGNETTIGNRADGGLYVSCSTPQPAADLGAAAKSPGKGSPGPVSASLSAPPKRSGAITPARWEMLSMGSAVRLTVVDAWFDPGTCRATVVQRTSITPSVLPGGVLYGYRTTCQPRAGSDEAECGGREAMVVLAPALTHLALSATTEGAEASRGMFTRATLPLQRGGGASMVSRVDAGVLRDWLGEKDDPARRRQVLLGVEVVQGVADREAIAVSYAQPLE